ncbi:MAG TPA: alanine racemase, partial [Lachnospiraceae bacterium]|nr:alanine racemase [Lachnospiraceae bacterium]
LGVDPGMRHVCNSAGIMELPEYQLDAVRAGITIYGIYPSEEVDRSKMKLKGVMTLVSHIAYIKELPEGCPVSYGGTFVTKRRSRIATIPAGYGDGYPRLLSNKGSVLIRGQRAPIVGRVCMDQFMVDVTDLEASEFDPVILLGKDGKDEITPEELGRLSGRFPYELTCDINQRVPRVYVQPEV